MHFTPSRSIVISRIKKIDRPTACAPPVPEVLAYVGFLILWPVHVYDLIYIGVLAVLLIMVYSTTGIRSQSRQPVDSRTDSIILNLLGWQTSQ